ncbi:MAG: glyoxalase [Rhodospirillaceae bacterium]|jgi:catechol 2,3-dioxygenase-like lactoylglutathione lyase family enzyme|nr:glyoxalase [Rhodospirillaceae bacterium]
MKLDHYSVRTNELDAVKDFFCDVADLQPGDRPPFKFPGYWLYDAETGAAIVHLIGIDNTPGDSTGAADHMAFTGDGARYDAIAEKVLALPYPHEMRTVPGRGLRQIFVTGPHGLVVELNFPPPD